MAEALTLPEGEPIAGRPLTLLEAFSTVRDRGPRMAVTHAYWNLARAVAEYRICWDEYTRLSEFQAGVSDRGLLQTAQAAAATALESADLGVVESQHELAEAAMLPAGTPLPLPADRPHVGTYRTEFEKLFAGQGPPARLRLINRLLPVELRLIVARATAVEAARDALDAASEAYRAQHADLAAVLSALRDWGVQRREAMDAVARYNHDIAEYALTIAKPDTNGETLVSMLIDRKRSGPTSPPKRSDTTTTETSQGVQPAEYTEPVKNEPTLAPPQPGGLRPAVNQPTLAPPREQSPASLPSSPATVPQRPTTASPQPTFAPPQGSMGPANSTDGSRGKSDDGQGQGRPGGPVLPGPNDLPRPVSAEPTKRTAEYPAGGAMGFGSVAPLYPALVDVEAAIRAKHLTAALYGNPASPDAGSAPITLGECLRGIPLSDRSAVIDAFWLSRQRTAEYQVFSNEVEAFRELVPIVLERRSAPSGPGEMLRLQAARSAAEAGQVGVQLDLLESQFELMRRAGRPLDTAWLLPSTLPHAGPYRLSLEGQPQERAGSWPIRKLAAAIPAMSNHVQDLAAVVVESDVVRVQATGEYQAGRRSLGDVVHAIRQETEETLAYLDRLTTYNQQIGRYALAVVPTSLPDDQFVKTLVLSP